jgi:hypothetical protein
VRYRAFRLRGFLGRARICDGVTVLPDALAIPGGVAVLIDSGGGPKLFDHEGVSQLAKVGTN